MTSAALEEIQRDPIAMRVARVLASANEAALTHGTNPADALITITEDPPSANQWQVHYGPRDYRNCRGGDLIVLVDGQTGTVQRVNHGQ